MSRAPRILAYTAGGLVVLVALAAIILPLFFDADTYRTELETRVSATTGQELRIGDLDFGFFPRLEVVARDIGFGPQDAALVAIRQVELGIDMLPLLRREVRINRVALQEPAVVLERLADGSFNIGKRQSSDAPLPKLELRNVRIADGSLLFRDAVTGSEYQLETCDIEVANASVAGNHDGAELIAFYARLSLTAQLACATVRKNEFALDGVGFTVNGTNGVFKVLPAMQLFGSRSEGSLEADFSGATARYELDFRLPALHIESFIDTLAQRRLLEGRADFAAHLTLQGNTRDALKRSLNGRISLSGEDLTLYGKDLDEEFKLYETSQTFTLVDMGALLVAGPLGVVATKGYDFGNLFLAEGTQSHIRRAVSDWTVVDGLATADDVAIATEANRLALKGTLDFPAGQFQDVTFALLDANGCAKVEQKIRGSFADPEVDKPGILASLAGPAMSLLEQGAELLGDEEQACEPFYAGSLEPAVTAAPE